MTAPALNPRDLSPEERLAAAAMIIREGIEEHMMQAPTSDEKVAA